ncbi:unnamed protein product (macronuclear) [Paramecium tetraurelia]|uniref:Uncharacterized protein n=1 Tax=Paramecium tetraurelia TaxID=5888 RepID=A0C7L4_PARTE|nr:uncharacterized protein GSPATT00035911001 [Paramecium tetraurelia]CAK66781.1 unnamed protein product [Paramecium tetraurelia]|eukprot:XP_001434178.1 hypothetical protein (macronuclear) [Paramecium tetraurelia strain d4-2]
MKSNKLKPIYASSTQNLAKTLYKLRKQEEELNDMIQLTELCDQAVMNNRALNKILRSIYTNKVETENTSRPRTVTTQHSFRITRDQTGFHNSSSRSPSNKSYTPKHTCSSLNKQRVPIKRIGNMDQCFTTTQLYFA